MARGITGRWLLFCLRLSLGFPVLVHANCPRPEPTGNMMLTGEALLRNDFPEGSAATFKCGVGYESAGGQSSISCIGGKWTEVTLKCRKKSCGSPGEVQNGRFDISEGIEFGATVKAICDEGYENVGQSYRQCLDQGWTGRIPKCEVVKCQGPPEVRNGMIAFKPSTEYPHYRDVVQYACSDGYTLVGEMSIMCNASGEYEPQAPECRDISCETPNVPNGRRVDGALPPYKLHNFVKYECNEGYKMDGRAQITCTVNGWSHSGPTCQPDEERDNKVPEEKKSFWIIIVIVSAVGGAVCCCGLCCALYCFNKKKGVYRTREEDLKAAGALL